MSKVARPFFVKRGSMAVISPWNNTLVAGPDELSGSSCSSKVTATVLPRSISASSTHFKSSSYNSTTSMAGRWRLLSTVTVRTSLSRSSSTTPPSLTLIPARRLVLLTVIDYVESSSWLGQRQQLENHPGPQVPRVLQIVDQRDVAPGRAVAIFPIGDPIQGLSLDDPPDAAGLAARGGVVPLMLRLGRFWILEGKLDLGPDRLAVSQEVDIVHIQVAQHRIEVHGTGGELAPLEPA